ncbi:defective chorion-1 protein, FC177 isoform isoform X1 [Drosophila biarmipes]|uniref:defective chorion-1 protein, FC177 isoform isoform X1 n=1 Tax=Drosophila biarmipes TaxID=125945 RepID=UPI0021CCB28D|nr:defective chorion-1 protein, FC177 isoform isoform X1 [Drosophila biarmipes]
MRLHSLLPLLALLAVQAAGQSDVASEDPAADAGPTTNTSTDTKPRIPTAEEILGQIPQIPPIRTGHPQMDAFYMMFPALGSLLRWGSLFPAHSILGAVPDTLQPSAAASKVVLVLAEDATAKTRVARQNPPSNPLGQLMSWPGLPQDFQMPAIPAMPDFGPQVGSFLSQMPTLPTMPGLLGAAAPVPAPAPAADPAPPAPAPAADPPAPPSTPDSPVAQQPILSQAALQNAFSLLNPANFDPNVLGQSLSQALPQLSQIPQMPQLSQLAQAAPQLPPANMDFVAQMQRQFFPALSQQPAGTDAQASDISEVRVRPEAQMAQQKIKSALERQQEQEQEQEQSLEQVPLLWFRMPTTQSQNAGEEKTLEDLQVEAKLRAFERQVIAELKMLQKIELLAKQMRSSAAAQSGDSAYRVSYPLSRTPVHKITRADIEQALRDDYVRRLVNKEAQRKAKNQPGYANQKANGLKRQTKAQDQPLSKEDIVQIMAYAYRMANEQMESEKGKQDKMYAAYRTGEGQRAQEQRQWSEDQAKIQQNEQQRQMAQNPQMIQTMQQQRQWTEEQAKIQHDQQMVQQNPMMMQQRQWSEDQAQAERMAQQNPMMMQQMQQRQWTEDPQMVQQMQQRQWAEDQARMQQQRQMAPEQRQWTEEQAQQMAQQNANAMMMQQMQQRQWSEDQAQIQQQRQMMQQNQAMMKQRQWAQENPQAFQQPMSTMAMQQPRMEETPTMMEENNNQGEIILGEAGPQMEENEGTARHKVDPLGVGGNKRKKSKSKSHASPPAVINYYYPAPVQRPAAQGYGSSYGTSYGGGGYGSNAYGVTYPSNVYQNPGYRAAVGNDEVDSMLRQHQTLARTINPQPQPGQVGGSERQESSSNPPLATTPAPQEQAQSQPQEHRVQKRLAIFHRFGRGIGLENTTSKGCGCGRLDCLCGRSCQCGRSGSGAGAGAVRSRGSCQCKANRRSKRSVEYGTLETIDEGSLNELRREYKMGLKEITLSPDEDPAEALMRYNAASIREALERASMEPLEIGGDQYEEGAPQEAVEEEPLQHDPNAGHQYNHQDFVRLTTSTAAPTTSTTEATTPGASETSTEASVTTTESPRDEDIEMQQDSVAESSHVTKSISKQEQEIHQLHKIVDQLKREILKLHRRCNRIISNNVVKEEVVTKREPSKVEQESSRQAAKPKVEEVKNEGEPATVEQEEEQEEDEDAEGASSSSTTTTSTTTETPPTNPPKPETKSQTAQAKAQVDEPSGSTNKLDYEDDTNWQRILANRGYDTDYLTKNHETQFAQGQNLEMPKPCNYDNHGSQEYGPYPEFQADEPHVAAETEGKTKRALSVKQQAQLLNAALNDGGIDASDSPTTPTPYALRGKFVRRRRTPSPRIRKESDDGWVRSTRQVKMPQRPKKSVPLAKKVTAQVTTQATVSSTKLDSLVDVLKDLLRLQIQREKKSSLLASQSNSLSKSPKPIKPIKVIKRKRLRRRQHKPMATTIRSSIQPKA